MKLFYATGTRSLFPHIVANEEGIALDLMRVDIFKTPHIVEDGSDYSAVNSNGYVPALKLNDGTVLTEGVAIAQYLADLKPESGLVGSQHRGTQRYVPTVPADEDALTRAIIALASDHGRYGYRRVTALLQAAGWQVGKDRVHPSGASG